PEEEREKVADSLLKEIRTENFPNLGKIFYLQLHEVNRTPNYINIKKTFSKAYNNKTGKSQ
ncbi:hypothetical protein, partial [Clostridioides difficile]|uniref:hypothetical protein n=1 Tax=Clostridioides difficile TaxID=1496 RepID=UPI001305034D